MSDFELAQINIGRLIAPLDDPRIAEFVAGLAPMNALAESSEGFIWRLVGEGNDATEVAYNDDPLIIVNMSVWTSPEALRDYAYRTEHVEFFRKRQQWFHKHDQAGYCLWWVPAGHRPSVAEGRDRLEHYRKHGATEHSFWFSQLFPAPTAVLA